MGNFAVQLLIGLNALLGVEPYPSDFAELWHIDKNWEITAPNINVFEASSEEIPKICASSITQKIVFPRVIHSAHEIYLDGRLIYKTGDPSFQKASPFYFRPTLDCASLANGHEVRWRVSSYSRYFSRFSTSPLIAPHAPFNLFDTTFNLIATGVIVVISFFSLMIFWGRVAHTLTLSITGGGILLSSYFLNVVNAELGLGFSMLLSHKLADLGLWIGGSLIFYALFIDQIFSKKMYATLLISTFAGSLIIMAGTSGDEVQLGTMIPMGPFLFCNLVALYRLIRSGLSSGFNRHTLTRVMAMGFFLVSSNNDILNVFGIIDTPLLLSVGIVGVVFGLSVAVNQEIEKTYKERDGLLADLERKVEEKTEHLTQALSSLKSTQAELIQSARLAALGTLSAGVAHEINNSINYVNGALRPLEKNFLSKIPEADQKQAKKLFDAIKEGTHLTVEIVKSLRNYTGLNQASVKEVKIVDVANTVLTIQKSKLRNVSVTLSIPDHLVVIGSMVGLNQILMNIVSNAIDAMPQSNASLIIEAQSDDNWIKILIRDNGGGIPNNIRDQIFDPFFTTKDVGKGTGLGLHIVKKEVDRHRGKLFVESEPNVGTTFSIWLPVQSHFEGESAA